MRPRKIRKFLGLVLSSLETFRVMFKPKVVAAKKSMKSPMPSIPPSRSSSKDELLERKIENHADSDTPVIPEEVVDDDHRVAVSVLKSTKFFRSFESLKSSDNLNLKVIVSKCSSMKLKQRWEQSMNIAMEIVDRYNTHNKDVVSFN
jgi:hypothetical protein